MIGKPERDVTDEFIELMRALDWLVDGGPGALEVLPVEAQARIARVVQAHLEFRGLVENYDTVMRRSGVEAALTSH